MDPRDVSALKERAITLLEQRRKRRD